MTKFSEPRVRERSLRRGEQRFACTEPFVRVVEPTTRLSSHEVCSVISRHAAAILGALEQHGSVLLRGFPIRDALAFEALGASIAGLHALDGYRSIEPGRERLRGTRTVFCTNRFVRTGGGLSFTGLHNENFYGPEVPSVQAFCCLVAPILGGETALVHMGKVYEALGAPLRAQLEHRPALASVLPIEEVARRHGAGVPATLKSCLDADLTVETIAGRECLVTYKPLVLERASDGRRALHANFSSEIPGLDAWLAAFTAPYYRDWRWTLHRAAWRNPALVSALHGLCAPQYLARRFEARARRIAGRIRGDRRPAAVAPRSPSGWAPRHPRLADAFRSSSDVRELAVAVWKNMVAIPWRRGDVLLFDNLRVAHAGLPGLGPRELAVQMYNSIILRPDGSGLLQIDSP